MGNGILQSISENLQFLLVCAVVIVVIIGVSELFERTVLAKSMVRVRRAQYVTVCGMLGAILAGLITGYATNTYLNLSLFLACAVLFPETEVNLIIIPVKMKWLALVYLLPVVQQLLTSNLLGILALVMSLLNVILFFYGDLIQRIRDFRRRQQWKRNWK